MRTEKDEVRLILQNNKKENRLDMQEHTREEN